MLFEAVVVWIALSIPAAIVLGRLMAACDRKETHPGAPWPTLASAGKHRHTNSRT